ncbi:pseudouridine synthase, partial [Sulfolobus sp. E3]
RDWKNAFYSIVSYPFLSESEEMRQFRRLILEDRFDEALNRLSVKFKQEQKLIKSYIRFRNYYLALKNSLIPISLYLDAYQSYLFNIYLSRKLDELKKYNDKEKLYIRLPIYLYLWLF